VAEGVARSAAGQRTPGITAAGSTFSADLAKFRESSAVRQTLPAAAGDRSNGRISLTELRGQEPGHSCTSRQLG